MKLLVATCTYPPFADGCSEAAAVLARGLAERGHSVTVATGSHPCRKPDGPGANPRVEQFDLSGSSNWRGGVQGCVEPYQKLLREFSGDLIIFETWDAWSTYLAEPLLSQLKAKKVLVSHGYAPHIWGFSPRFPWGLGLWLGGWPLLLRTPRLLRRFDHVVFLSQRRDFGRFFDHRLARATGFKNYSIIPNGAFAREFNDGSLPDFRKEFGLAGGPMLLYVANYCDRKNQKLAVRAFRHARLENAALVLIGSEFNAYSEQVRQLDAQLQREFPVGRVLLLEKLNRIQTCAAFRAADLFVLCAKAETQPIVLLEAMASRTPFLSTDVGCVREMPGGVVAKSEREFVARMQSLISSPARRQQLAEEGWLACQRTYDWDRVVDEYERLLTRLVRGGSPGRSLTPATPV